MSSAVNYSKSGQISNLKSPIEATYLTTFHAHWVQATHLLNWEYKLAVSNLRVAYPKINAKYLYLKYLWNI